MYVDKPQFWVYFKVTDAYGSPIFARENSNSVTLAGEAAGSFNDKLQSFTCTSGTSLGELLSSTWMYTCKGEGKPPAFSSTQAVAGALKITANGAGGASTETTVGGTHASLNQLTLAQTPDWWHADLRATTRTTPLQTPYSSDYSNGDCPVTPAQPLAITSPTYPVYEGEAFDVHIYNVAWYDSNMVAAFGFTIFFDTSQVEYIGVTYDPLFPAGNTNANDASSGKVTMISTSVLATASYAANAQHLWVNGFFPYAKVAFRLKAGATLDSDGLHVDTGIYLSIAEVNNDGNMPLSVDSTWEHNPGLEMKAGENGIYASIFDARLGSDTFGGTNTDGIHLLAATQNDRFVMYNYDKGNNYNDHGQVFNRRAIDGSDAHDTDFHATVVNDYMTYALRNNAHSNSFYTVEASHTCAPAPGSSSSNYESLPTSALTTCSLRTKVALNSDASNSRVEGTASGFTCAAQSSGTCIGTVDLRIVSPTTLTMELSDTTLNRIVPTSSAASCSTTNLRNSAYQTASVRVYADDLDVTSWATGMQVANTAIATFMDSPGQFKGTRDRQDQVRGKAVGTTLVKLHDQPGAPTVSITVSDTLVTVSEVIAHVVTDIEWTSAAPGYVSHPSTTTAQVTLKQTFTAKPAGTSRGHYGYLFVRAFYDDGNSEEVQHEDIVPIVRTSNLILTAPEARDEHAGTSELTMYNSGTAQYMVTLAKTAISECAEFSVQVNTTRCGVPLGVGHPKILVVMPDPFAIQFNISTNLNARDLTPTNDGAAFSPFLNTFTVPTSDFRLVVFYDDGSSVDTFANEPDSVTSTILYYSYDASCATVDNDANTVTVVEGATCSEVDIGVNVTIGGALFVGRDTARVVRLQALTTTAQAYPGGWHVHDAADLLPLPCNVGYEKYTLATQGTLDSGTVGTISTSIVSYSSSDATVAGLEGANRVSAEGLTGTGAASYGGTVAEFQSGWSAWNSTGVTISAFTATVSRTYAPNLYNYGASRWNSVPGGTTTSAAVAPALSTLSIPAQTRSTWSRTAPTPRSLGSCTPARATTGTPCSSPFRTWTRARTRAGSTTRMSSRTGRARRP